MSWYIPHLDLIGSAVLLTVALGVLILFHRSRDRMMEYKFLTREDFRRVESKIDELGTMMIQAPWLSVHTKGAIRPKWLDHEES